MQIAKYFIVGGVAASLDLAIFTLLIYALDINYLLSGAISFIFATGINYSLSIRYVFQSRARFSRKTELVAVYIVSGFGLIINQSVLYAGVEIVGLHLLVSKITAMTIVFLWNYLSRKHFVFADKRDSRE